jgi:hypothetical protein
MKIFEFFAESGFAEIIIGLRLEIVLSSSRPSRLRGKLNLISPRRREGREEDRDRRYRFPMKRSRRFS